MSADIDNAPAGPAEAAAASDDVKTDGSQGREHPLSRSPESEADAGKPVSTSLHPGPTELTDALDAQLHPEVAQVAPASHESAADDSTPAAGSVDRSELAELPESPHAFGLKDLTQFQDASLPKPLEEPLQAGDLVGAVDHPQQNVVESRDSETRASAQDVESSQTDSAQAGESSEPESAQAGEIAQGADLDGLLGDTVENIGSDSRYASILSKDGARPQSSTTQDGKEASSQVGPCKRLLACHVLSLHFMLSCRLAF